MKGLLIISEAIQSLQWEALWLKHSKEEFKDELEYLEHFFPLFKNKDINIQNVTNEAVIKYSNLERTV